MSGGFTHGHQLKQSDEHYTPKWLFDELGIEFDMDVCAPVGGVPWLPAKKSFSVLDDGLAQVWVGSVWMNPPFSKPTPWVDKFIAHGDGIALMVVSRSKWFKELWNASDVIVPTPWNLRFERPDGSSKQIAFQTFLFAIGEKYDQSLTKLNDYKARR
jgi:hypothetical protein